MNSGGPDAIAADTAAAGAELRPNGPSVAALLFGACSLLISPLAPVAIACGIWSRRRLREYPDSAGGTMTIIGLTLGSVGMLELASLVLVVLTELAH